MVFCFGGQKGGVSKSTLAVNFACYFSFKKEKVAILDCDMQGTATRWVEDRKESEKKDIDCFQARGNVTATIEKLRSQYDVVIIDTAGRDCEEFRRSLLLADFAILPFRPSQADLDTLPFVSSFLKEAQCLNLNLKARGVLSFVSTNIFGKERIEAEKYFEIHGDFPLLKSVIHDRKVYRDALSHGLGVVEMKDKRAKLEFERLMEEIING